MPIWAYGLFVTLVIVFAFAAVPLYRRFERHVWRRKVAAHDELVRRNMSRHKRHRPGRRGYR